MLLHLAAMTEKYNDILIYNSKEKHLLNYMDFMQTEQIQEQLNQ